MPNNRLGIVGPQGIGDQIVEAVNLVAPHRRRDHVILDRVALLDERMATVAAEFRQHAGLLGLLRRLLDQFEGFLWKHHSGLRGVEKRVC
jgi:hypothetical protein